MAVNMTAQSIAVGDNWVKVGNDYIGDNPSGGFTGDWQLSATNYVDRVIDPELIFPRPDSETPVWAKHRRHHPSVPYRIPIGISFGSWPFYFEAISVPSGATVGSFLTASGDKLIVGDDYGVVEWTNPTAGNHSFHIRVHFQDGYAPLDVQWTLEVTTAGTIFIDPTALDNTGAGTIADPFKTIDAWYLNDLTDTTYSQYQVCYRGGAHNVSADNSLTGVNYGNWQLNGNDKPLVHYGYSGEAVTFDMSNTTVVVGFTAGQGTGPHGSDMFFSNIIFSGANAVSNPKQFVLYSNAGDRVYTAGQNEQRITFFEVEHATFTNTLDASNNAGILWAENAGTGKKRHYWLASRVTMRDYKDTTAGDGSAALNFNGYYVSNSVNHLYENSTVDGCDFGVSPYALKSGGINFCQRNVEVTNTPMYFQIGTIGGYDLLEGGGHEFSYCKLDAPTGLQGWLLLMNYGYDAYDSGNANHKPVYLTRNTLRQAEPEAANVCLIRSGGSWPFYMYGNFCQVDDMWYDVGNQENENSADLNDFVQVTASESALDASLNLITTYRTANLGQYGAEVINENN